MTNLQVKKSILGRDGIFLMKYFLVDQLTIAKKYFLTNPTLSRNRSKSDFWLWKLVEPCIQALFRTEIFYYTKVLTIAFVKNVDLQAIN